MKRARPLWPAPRMRVALGRRQFPLKKNPPKKHDPLDKNWFSAMRTDAGGNRLLSLSKLRVSHYQLHIPTTPLAAVRRPRPVQIGTLSTFPPGGLSSFASRCFRSSACLWVREIYNPWSLVTVSLQAGVLVMSSFSRAGQLSACGIVDAAAFQLRRCCSLVERAAGTVHRGKYSISRSIL